MFLYIVIIGLPIVMSKAGRFSELLLVLPEGYFEIVALGWAKIIPLVFSFLLSFLVAIDSLMRCFINVSNEFRIPALKLLLQVPT